MASPFSSKVLKFEGEMGFVSKSYFNDIGPFVDFVNRVETDIGIKILMCLDDPADIVRASAVSRYWNQFVIEHGLSKKLCLRISPHLSRIAGIVEINKYGVENYLEVGSIYTNEWDLLQREHKVFAYLAWACRPASVVTFISEAISTSSTDNYHNIRSALGNKHWEMQRPNYRSRKGQRNPAMTETLIYKLKSELCVVSEINVKPFGDQIVYFPKAFRFRLGHLRSSNDADNDATDDKFVWTYISPEFPVAKKADLQRFELLEPALCIGGYLQVELPGQLQRNAKDGLYYTIISYVQAYGRSLPPAFNFEILDSGKYVLRYDHRRLK